MGAESGSSAPAWRALVEDGLLHDAPRGALPVLYQAFDVGCGVYARQLVVAPLELVLVAREHLHLALPEPEVSGPAGGADHHRPLWLRLGKPLTAHVAERGEREPGVVFLLVDELRARGGVWADAPRVPHPMDLKARERVGPVPRPPVVPGAVRPVEEPPDPALAPQKDVEGALSAPVLGVERELTW